ncbi:glutathione synthase [Chryseobacterium chendengshani]|uniref:glutathione synthase n=1 Tax=unclassified Chryseobacterium TaxID=2593645 RepID=UPI001C6428A6|nr:MULTISPECIES: glutathione synthase [unclassified Chryseobacterium]MBW7676340.1 glutathione synthase [Chryseobacterium sp. LJ756]MBW8523712.1 glutathione synthase [Chryseobacterium sp. LJ668]QYK16656.1 glutathione synthase [Chryseobacterium sp. LJ668]
MAKIDFKKEDFVKTQNDGYQLEYTKSEIGEGSNLTIEKKNEDGTYTVIQVPIRRFKESIFIAVDEAIDGRIIFE